VRRLRPRRSTPNCTATAGFTSRRLSAYVDASPGTVQQLRTSRPAPRRSSTVNPEIKINQLPATITALPGRRVCCSVHTQMAAERKNDPWKSPQASVCCSVSPASKLRALLGHQQTSRTLFPLLAHGTLSVTLYSTTRRLIQPLVVCTR